MQTSCWYREFSGFDEAVRVHLKPVVVNGVPSALAVQIPVDVRRQINGRRGVRVRLELHRQCCPSRRQVAQCVRDGALQRARVALDARRTRVLEAHRVERRQNVALPKRAAEAPHAAVMTVRPENFRQIISFAI